MKKVWKVIKWLFLWLIGLWILFFIQFFVFKKDALDMSLKNYTKYVGTWELENTEEHSTLVIEKNWYMQMVRNYWNSNTSISWPISSIEDGEMEVSFWLFHVDYEITTPIIEWSDTVMNVDWKKFIKQLWLNELSIPEKEEIIALLSGTFSDLDNGLKKSDLSNMYQNSAKLWQKQFSWVEEFSEKFIGIFWDLSKALEKEIWVWLNDFLNKDFTISQNPYIWNHWELVIKWNFISSPIAYFEVSYLYEYPEWKLVGIEIWFD